jgi:hypothetical protein
MPHQDVGVPHGRDAWRQAAHLLRFPIRACHWRRDTVLICCAPLKDFRLEGLDDAAHLDAETAAGYVQMKLHPVAHRRHVGWTVPRGLDSKIFGMDSGFVGRHR